MIRLRNEELLLEDTLDHLAAFTDGIVVYDDASTDQSRQIALRHPHVIEVITNRHWRKTNRIWEETANRRMLYRRTLRHRPEWVFYSDADERFEGDIRETLLSGSFRDVQAVRVSLYDAYLTPDDRSPFTQGDVLWNFRRYFGPERRRILMAWRPGHLVDYRLPDSREPHGIEGVVVSSFSCQHYGKAQSEEQWDETCRYYIERFPDIYAEKWRKRLGRAIHTESDFGAPLVTWDQVEAHAVDI
jgi:glycosyltransferase involved in cell wall biosynthesis